MCGGEMNWQERPTRIFKGYVGVPGKSTLQSYPKEKGKWPESNDKDKSVKPMDGKTARDNTSRCFS